ncbi:hypothetical protein B9Z19DRAFT_1122545 [Tuber borchii]|uniref:Uncharacterized protein n=1 Tax=Tuber borchii TaxID=42251 RepID=A0A2T7A053_TUBBO|nr:hypothetical protein B9Z19DRAFT_1122545 [Tuber borchii]
MPPQTVTAEQRDGGGKINETPRSHCFRRRIHPKRIPEAFVRTTGDMLRTRDGLSMPSGIEDFQHTLLNWQWALPTRHPKRSSLVKVMTVKPVKSTTGTRELSLRNPRQPLEKEWYFLDVEQLGNAGHAGSHSPIFDFLTYSAKPGTAPVIRCDL